MIQVDGWLDWRGSRPARHRRQKPCVYSSKRIAEEFYAKCVSRRVYSRARVDFPIAALADVSNTVTISSGQSYSLDTGTTSSSGGDIAFTGTSITFVGNAAGDSLSLFGVSSYSFLTVQSLAQASYSPRPSVGRRSPRTRSSPFGPTATITQSCDCGRKRFVA